MKKKISKIAAFIVLIIFLNVLCVFSQRNINDRVKSSAGNSSIVRGNIGKALDEYMRRLEAYGFSGSLLVAKDDNIFLAKGYGLADRERAIPVTPDTTFEGASLNKQFTAAAIMKLEELGKLRVEDPITKYFNDVPDDKKAITLHQLMTHSAGFPNEFGRSDVDYEKDPNGYYYQDRDQFIRAILNAPLEYPPGTKAAYSNPSYSVVAAIVEKVSGQSYESFVREHLLIPAGLTSTGFYSDAQKWNPARVSKGFNGSVEIERLSYERGWGVIGAGGILTSVSDLYKWELALRGNKILSSKSKEKLFGARVPSGSGFDYAYGWRWQKSPRGTNIIWASGLVPEFSAMFQRYVDENVTIIFLTNNSLDGFPYRDVLVIPGFGGTIERIVFGREYTLPPWFAESKTPTLQNYTGTYKTSAGDEFVVSVDKNALRIAPHSQSAADLLIPPITDTPAPDYAKYHEQIEKGLNAYKSGNKDEAYKQIRFEGEKLEKQYGRFFGVERMLTLPVVRGRNTHRATTYTELKFERGIVSYRWHWWNGELYEQHKPKSGKQLAILPPFREQSPGEFVTYHIFMGTSLRVTFKLGSDGSARLLSFGNPKGIITATKIGG